MTTPVRFVTRGLTSDSPEQVAHTILDLENWNSFKGWGPLPGIREATFLAKPEGIVGTRFGVTNTDGSKHVEEIIEWDPARRVRVRMHEFPKPLNMIASEFVETFHLTVRGDGTLVEREFEMTPRHALTRPMLVVIGWMLKKAITRHSESWGAAAVS
jgi:hypothetical protein